QLVMLFGTSNPVREAFLSLFYKTFGARLSAADPHRLALATGLDRQRIDALREITPVRWPDAQRGASGQPAPSGQTAPRTQEVGA
ncbi:MAG: hypothetical protein KDC95_24450, partial [Planctomycetes bacterium]|nr:hypothetical protein [Planctomycetota bacterium]